MKAVVIVMAVLIFVGLIAVVWAIFNLNKPTEDRDVARLPAELSLELPAGCEIAGMELDGGRLAVRTTGAPSAPDCERIYIVDLSRGEVVGIVER
jgi:hypothetical protein